MDADGPHRRRVRHHPRTGSRDAHAGVPGSLCAGHCRRLGGIFSMAGEAMIPSAYRTSLVALVLTLLCATQLRAQVSPNKRYFTLHTAHFYIHFTKETEPTARRVAIDAERAYAQLASELHPPRGPIDVVISDDADYSNGSATPFPTNRIVVYANPPIQNSSLRFTDDWGAMVITHELTHIFHLDRSRGLWRVAQYE